MLQIITQHFSILTAVFMLPLVLAFACMVLKNKRLIEVLSLVTAVITFICVLQIYNSFEAGLYHKMHAVKIVSGLKITLSCFDILGIIFALIASFLWIVTTIYSIGYLSATQEKRYNNFYAFFSLSIFATLGVAFSDNLFTTFVFYEILTFATFPLVGLRKDEAARAGAKKYLGYLLFSSFIFFLPAIIITKAQLGSLNYYDIAFAGSQISNPYIMFLLLIMFMYGIGKAALMPLHSWLPAAMVAPTPVSALLHAVAVVKAGLFVMIKVIYYVLGTENLSKLQESHPVLFSIPVLIAAASLIISSIMACKQDNLKLRLAYSTVSQLSYCTLACLLFSKIGIIAAILQIICHAFGKITLFFGAGIIYCATGKKKISEFSGFGRAMPITTFAMAVGAVSMIGFAPAAGALSKYYLVEGVVNNSLLVTTLLLSTFLNALYFTPILYKMVIGNLDAKACRAIKYKTPKLSVFAICITALGTMLIFVYSSKILGIVNLFFE